MFENGLSYPEDEKRYADTGSESSGGAVAEGQTGTQPKAFTYKDYAESDAVKNAGAAVEDHKATKPGAFTYKDYAESETVRQAKAALDAQLSTKPGEYSSKWQAQIDDMLARIEGREDFSYDVNADALYQQYKDQYLQAGRMAMADTMGQAAAMTGGYGNSYAASAGNQAYQGYLRQLTAMIPELEGRAYDHYLQEGQEMQDLYAMYRDREDQDYGRYRDSVADFERERDYLTGRYDTERDLDYGRYVDDRNLAYTDYRNQIADSQWRESFDEGVRQYDESMDYQKQQDEQAYYQWAKEFQEGQRQFNQSMKTENEHWNAEFEFAKSQYEDAKAGGDETTALQHVATLSSEDLVSIVQSYGVERDFDGMEAFLLDCVASGRITEEQMLDFIDKFVIPDTGSNSSGIGNGQSNSSGAVNFG